MVNQTVYSTDWTAKRIQQARFIIYAAFLDFKNH